MFNVHDYKEESIVNTERVERTRLRLPLLGKSVAGATALVPEA
jgi:hypothetical protein